MFLAEWTGGFVIADWHLVVSLMQLLPCCFADADMVGLVIFCCYRCGLEEAAGGC